MELRGRKPEKPKCVGINAETGVGCTFDAMPGNVLCGKHMGKNVPNLIPGYANAPRSADLAKFLGGDQFTKLYENKQDLYDFEVDAAIFARRQHILAERLLQNDSTSFRNDIRDGLNALKSAYIGSGGENEAFLAKLDVMIEFATEHASNDDSWEDLLNGTERRLKNATMVMNALTKERNSFTLHNLVGVLGKVIDIIAAECGADATNRVSRRIESEIIYKYGEVAQEQIMEAEFRTETPELPMPSPIPSDSRGGLD